MTLLAQVTEERRGDVVVVRVSGEIDASNAAWLDDRLRGALTNRSDGLAVDLTETTYIDSAGLALLFGLATSLRSTSRSCASWSPTAPRSPAWWGSRASPRPSRPIRRWRRRSPTRRLSGCRSFRVSSTRCR